MVFSATLGDTPFLGQPRWQEVIWAGEVCNIWNKGTALSSWSLIKGGLGGSEDLSNTAT